MPILTHADDAGAGQPGRKNRAVPPAAADWPWRQGRSLRSRPADGVLPRSVALKVIRCVWEDADDDPSIAQRFLAERQILGTLNHPNIARLLDGGTDDSGAPYVAMEYIEGLTLDRYLTDRKPDRATRLHLFLFLELCEAVQYAHRHLIVHRDLKAHQRDDCRGRALEAP